MAIFACVLITIVLVSVVEGLFHQYILHTAQKKLFGGVLTRAFKSHALEHHPQFRDEAYHHEPTHEDKIISLGPLTLPATLIFFSPWIYLSYVIAGVGGVIGVVATILGYYAFYEFLHWQMHFPGTSPKGRLFRRYPPLKQLFEWFDKRHFVHHLADDRNYNVVLPLYDLAIGTYTTDIEKIPRAIRQRTQRNMKKADALRQKIASER